MIITYLAHSGFLAESNTAYLLFDYFEGTIPVLNTNKPLFVFVSHRHKDHMNPEIFELKEKYPLTEYFLSYDIRIRDSHNKKWKIKESYKNSVHSVAAGQKYEYPYSYTGENHLNISDVDYMLKVSALKSTDAGVAFLVECDGRMIYHAGDLNWWVWPGDSKQEYNNMTARFKKEIDSLIGKRIDIAFLPLDPRQEEYYCLGFDYVLQKVKPDIVFPMHMWDEYDIIGRYKNNIKSRIMKIEYRGQVFNVDEKGDFGDDI